MGKRSSRANLRMGYARGQVPLVGDPIWEEIAEPILAFLEEPRDWNALGAWAKENAMALDFLREALAWCSINQKADLFYFKSGGKNVPKWRSLIKPEEPIVTKPHTNGASKKLCPHCGGKLFCDGSSDWRCLFCGRAAGLKVKQPDDDEEPGLHTDSE